MKLIKFFTSSSENRTQFFIVMGFIVFPVIAMIYVFVEVVMDNSHQGSERMRVPSHLLENHQQQENQR